MEVKGNNLKETQEQLIKLLGFDYDVFRTTSCFEQNEADAFSKLNPKEAKSLIMKLLQLEVYEKYERSSRDKANLLENELNKLLIKRSTIDDMAKTQTIDVAKIEEELKNDSTKLSALQTLKPLVIKVVELKKKILELRTSKQKFQELGKCPTCLQEVAKEHKEKVIKIYDNTITKFFNEIVPDLETSDDNTLRDIDYNISLAQSRVARNKAILEGNVKTVQSVKANIEELDKSIAIMRDEVVTYKKLVDAFGRNGIPSLIIENSIPEIEDIANVLLDELEISMQVKLDLQKELKSGGLADTLDITICRDRWSKSYFGYSGGERFLIDLVLRIALSVLLLRRKGCNNSTIIIDEGFGNLDKVNREKALKLISVINEKFGFLKIIIISHISEIQDSIGKKIRIVKHGEESTIEG